MLGVVAHVSALAATATGSAQCSRASPSPPATSGPTACPAVPPAAKSDAKSPRRAAPEPACTYAIAAGWKIPLPTPPSVTRTSTSTNPGAKPIVAMPIPQTSGPSAASTRRSVTSASTPNAGCSMEPTKLDTATSVAVCAMLTSNVARSTGSSGVRSAVYESVTRWASVSVPNITVADPTAAGAAAPAGTAEGADAGGRVSVGMGWPSGATGAALIACGR